MKGNKTNIMDLPDCLEISLKLVKRMQEDEKIPKELRTAANKLESSIIKFQLELNNISNYF